jgi:hypothetical protein
VGDVNPDEAERAIAEKFGRLTAEKQGSEIRLKEIKDMASDLADAVLEGSVKAAQSWHYPPVRHDWCVPKDYHIDPKLVIPAEGMKYDLQLQDSYPLDDKVDFLKTESVGPDKKIRPHIFRYVSIFLVVACSFFNNRSTFLFILIKLATFAAAMSYCSPFQCTCLANGL